MKNIIIFFFLCLAAAELTGQHRSGIELIWLKNNHCFSDNKPREIFKIIQSPPMLNRLSMQDLEIQIQDVLEALNILQNGKVLLSLSVYFMADGSRCISGIETDNQAVNQEKLRQLFENQTLFLDFLPGRQLDVPKDAEGSIILRIKDGKIKSLKFTNLGLNQ